MSTRKVRYKKLNIKTPLPVLREHQIDSNEYESLTTESQIATGVEQAEENEYHLQAALRGVGTSTDNEIPVPPPQDSNEVNYEELYPTPYVEPRHYIKFSDTVEETLKGSLYDMTSEDDEFLREYNSKKPAHIHLSENDFERIMEIFEETAAESTPFADVDNTFVPYELMSQTINLHIREKHIQAHAKPIYEHWRARRQATGNKALHPSLKFETHQEHDDMDPYVCFRRREVRQTRKTRARDVQVADKLKKLRRELEDGRQLVVFAQKREHLKRELLKTDKSVYEQRAKLKDIKIKLNIKTDDDDLVNTKPQKRQKQEAQQPARTTPHPQQLRLTVRPDGARAIEPVELTHFNDKQSERQAELLANIEVKVQEHRRWNANYIDLTADPLPPVKEKQQPNFRPAKTSFLITPPNSATESMDLDVPTQTTGTMLPPHYAFRGTSTEGLELEVMQCYRRRVGRLGRMWIDRRPGSAANGVDGLDDPSGELESLQSDRWKYDDDDDDEPAAYKVDTNSLQQLKFRSSIPPPASLFRRPGVDIAQLQAANRSALPQAQGLMQGGQGQAQGQGKNPALVAQGQAPSKPEALGAQGHAQDMAERSRPSVMEKNVAQPPQTVSAVRPQAR